MADTKIKGMPTVKAYVSMPVLAWLGGAVHVYHQPGYGFWDALIWLYYVGRFVAVHFVVLS